MEKQRILGLDPGTNSLGWAVLDFDNSKQEYNLVRKGEVIFEEGVGKSERGEFSKAAYRTFYKSTRKHYFRRRLRKIEVLKVLVKYDFCPYLSDDLLKQWHEKKIYPAVKEFMDWQRTSDAEGKNPYYDRHCCLNEKLDLSLKSDRYILGRALYHLTQRRGFKSNRLIQNNDENEEGKVKKGISELSTEMQEANCNYLGDYFYKLYTEKGNTVQIRKRYTDREKHYKNEFNAICEKQELNETIVKELDKAIFFQRKLKPQRHGVGKCTFEPNNRRCAISHPDFERFRMLCFINNIKIKTPFEENLRPLNNEEKALIEPLFYRKSIKNFDFEEIAKKLAGKNNYCYIKDDSSKQYKFNYRMSQGASTCQTIAKLKSIFGEEWKNGIAETYTNRRKKEGLKNQAEMVDDIWNVLYSVSECDVLKDFAINKLQLDEKTADNFSKTKLAQGFATLSLKAIRKILPFLEQGFGYTEAVFLANIPTVVGKEYWNNEDIRNDIMEEIKTIFYHNTLKTNDAHNTILFCIKDILSNNFDLAPGAIDKLYHPSMINIYKDVIPNEDGILQLGSPKIDAVKNPMAMRSLHIIRKVVNELLREGIINSDTEVRIEYARELNDANKRHAIADWQKKQYGKHQKYRKEIKELFKAETGFEIEPNETDILKFELWEEQNHICLYTGQEIGISEFVGENPKYDIEHTIPRSLGGDSTKMNMTLCENKFNRENKQKKLPSELANHSEILERIDDWKKKIYILQKKYDSIRTHNGMDKENKDKKIVSRHKIKLELDYWKGKYNRFTMTEIPEGFSRRQGMGIGLISRYAGLYLKTIFHKKDNPQKSNVYIVKGSITAEFRRIWNIQDDYEKKCRDNHIHHCIDAIVVGCIGKREYDLMAQFYRDEEKYRWEKKKKPFFKKPWETFTQDMLSLKDEVLTVHFNPSNFTKKAHKKVFTPKGIFVAQGDCARVKLHKGSYFGAIEQKGKIKYVMRKELSALKIKDIKNIVDDVVKEKVLAVVKKKGFKQAMAEPIYMNEDKRILIKKVRLFVSQANPLIVKKHRDLSSKEYKQNYYVDNEGNLMIAMYEGVKKNGKIDREITVVNNLEAAKFFRQSQKNNAEKQLISHLSPKNGYPLKTVLTQKQLVLMYEDSPKEIKLRDTKNMVKRLYQVFGIEKDGRVKLKFHQEARSEGLNINSAAFKIQDTPESLYRHTKSNLKVLVNGVDFKINILGEISLI